MEKKEINKEVQEETIDVGEAFSILWINFKYIVLAVVIAALAAYGATKFLITPMYESTTRMYVLAKTSSESENVTSSDFNASSEVTKDYIELAKSRTVIESVIHDLKLDESYETMLKTVEVESTPNTRIVTIKVKNEDPYEAMKLANAIRDKASEHIKNVMKLEAINVVDKANLPSKPCSPNLKKNMAISILIGLALSIIIILGKHFGDDTLKSTEDVEKYLGLSILGLIPEEENLATKKGKRKGKRS